MATKRTKRFDVGGQVGSLGSNTYPFPSTNAAAPSTNTTVNVGGGETTPVVQQDPFANTAVQTMKKGGKVTASRRGDGIAQRGKTRGRMV